MYQSAVETTSDKSKGQLSDPLGPGSTRNNNKGYYRGLKNPTLTRHSGMKKSATQKQLGYQARMSLTTREPEADVVELKEQLKAKQKDLRNASRRSYGFKKDSFSELEMDPEKVNDDASSMTSGAHVRSVQNELKAQATYVPEMSGIQASDEEEGQLRGGDDHPMNQDVIQSRQLHFKISKSDMLSAPNSHVKDQSKSDAEAETQRSLQKPTPARATLSKFCTGCGWQFVDAQHKFCAQCGHQRM